MKYDWNSIRYHKNDCGHEVYLGSDDSVPSGADYYLYLDDIGLLSMCIRTGIDGEYQTISSTSKLFIKKLQSIVLVAENQTRKDT